jgi:GLPGLI family protein
MYNFYKPYSIEYKFFKITKNNIEYYKTSKININKMKKTIITIITIFIICNNIHAQFGTTFPRKDLSSKNNNSIDSGTVRIWYALNATDINKQETYDDFLRLEIGNQISKCYSFFVFNNDSLVSDWIKKHPTAQSYPHTLGAEIKEKTWNENMYSEYFKDFSSNLLTQYTRLPHGGIRPCQYSEDIPVQDWEIGEDTLTIAGYLCQKATCTFRGRNFTAWFAMDIPIQNGPWKFGGLPGLILKVYDDDKLYEFECTKIENFKKKYPITLHANCKNYEKTNRQKFHKFVKSLYNDFFNVAGWKNMDDSPPLVWKPIPYNPLEME